MLIAYTVIEVDNYYRSFFLPEIKTPKFYDMETHLKRWRNLHKILAGYSSNKGGLSPIQAHVPGGNILAVCSGMHVGLSGLSCLLAVQFLKFFLHSNSQLRPSLFLLD